MSTPIYYDQDADLSIIQAKRLAFIGYGNQGAAQAQNLRDSGVSEMLIGNREDRYKEAALASGFQVKSCLSPKQQPGVTWCSCLFQMKSSPRCFASRLHLTCGQVRH